jgi:sodium transport system permease protein
VSWRNVGVVYRKELTDSLRDRRTVVSMIVVPLVLMPLFTMVVGAISAAVLGTAMREAPAVMLLGGEDSPAVAAALRERPDLRVVPAQGDYADRIVDRRIRAAVEIPRDFDAALARGDVPTVRIYMYEGELRSGIAADRLQRFFDDLRDRTVRDRLAARQLPVAIVQPFRVEQTNVAPPQKVGGQLLGGLVPYFVILLSLTGAMYPAMDLTVGEKERGTIETILCSPVSRAHLVLGKFFMVLTASLATAALSMVSLTATLAIGRSLLAGTGEANDVAMQFAMGPKVVVLLFLMIVPLAVLFSATLMAIALFAKSYKEAQSYISPLTLVVVLPAVVSLLPGVELNAALALVPVLSTSLVSKEIVAGTYPWGYIALIFVSSCAYAAAALSIAIKLFQRESVLFRT